jgi:hypothetical protein
LGAVVQHVQREILITARTYPELSTKYRESVCTGGVFLDDGQWCRIYPFPARYLEKRVKHWDVIHGEVWQEPGWDGRPESHRIFPDSIERVGHIDTGRGHPPD